MSLPAPRPGLVIHYAYLWLREARAGAAEARKDRPCAIVLAVRRDAEGDLMVVVAPITRQPPRDPAAAVEIPAGVKAALGLDAERSWVMTDEVNQFAWPGFDLRPVPGAPGRHDYGMLPRPLFERVRRAILERLHARRARVVPRD